MTKTHQQATISKRWLSQDDLTTEYGFSKYEQTRLRIDYGDSSMIPYSKIGGKYIRYDRHEVDKWLEAHKVQGGEVWF